MKNFLKIPEFIYEDKHILIVNKPAGLIVQGAKEKRYSLLLLLKDFIKKRDKKQGNVFLSVVHRLDKVVSGALVLAKRTKSARRLSESFQKKEIIKLYLAGIEGRLTGEGIWEDYLIWDAQKRKAKLSNEKIENSKKAITIYSTLYSSQKYTYILLLPVTGRKHQLRVILSERGNPIAGDIKYGAKEKILNGQAILLHCLFLRFPHPVNREKMEFWAEIPYYFFFDLKYKEKIYEFLKSISNFLEGVKYIQLN